jgi:hypothetical protein
MKDTAAKALADFLTELRAGRPSRSRATPQDREQARAAKAADQAAKSARADERARRAADRAAERERRAAERAAAKAARAAERQAERERKAAEREADRLYSEQQRAAAVRKPPRPILAPEPSRDHAGRKRTVRDWHESIAFLRAKCDEAAPLPPGVMSWWHVLRDGMEHAERRRLEVSALYPTDAWRPALLRFQSDYVAWVQSLRVSRKKPPDPFSWEDDLEDETQEHDEAFA